MSLNHYMQFQSCQKIFESLWKLFGLKWNIFRCLTFMVPDKIKKINLGMISIFLNMATIKGNSKRKSKEI